MKKTYYLFNPGVLERKDNTLKFTPVAEGGEALSTDAQSRYLPVEDIADFYVFGSLRANSALFNFLGQKDIAIHFFDYYENYTGSFMPRDGLLSGRMLLAQTSHYQDKKKRMIIARKFIEGAAYNMIKNLQYYNRRGKDMEDIMGLIDNLCQRIPQTLTVEELMGIEGQIRQCYYAAFNLIINDYEMDGRSKQPPRNEVNALISFGNMVCYTLCLRAIHQTQLNPTISYLHEPGVRRFSLCLDISEIFKPLIGDRLIFSLLNRNQITEDSFTGELNFLHLKKEASQTVVREFEAKLKTTIMHKDLNRQVSYQYLIRLEAYKLIKHLIGEKEYEGFRIWW